MRLTIEDSSPMDKLSQIYIAGHKGMVGSAVVRQLEKEGYSRLIKAESKELDLRSQRATRSFFHNTRPEAVVIAAATVGGIMANNTYRADFIYNNLQIQSNIIQSAKETGVKKLILLGSSCIYPRNAPQPIKEEHLLTGVLEPTNEPYAIAKIAGLKMCESYFRQYDCNFYSLMPCNLYGINDNFDLQTSHVLPALLRKFHEAKENNDESVEIWGSGIPQREFLFVDDLARAISTCLQCVEAKDVYEMGVPHLNVGFGEDVSINELACIIKEVVGFKGAITFDTSKPNGTLRKLMDSSRASQLGIVPEINLREGIARTYKWRYPQA